MLSAPTAMKCGLSDSRQNAFCPELRRAQKHILPTWVIQQSLLNWQLHARLLKRAQLTNPTTKHLPKTSHQKSRDPGEAAFQWCKDVQIAWDLRNGAVAIRETL